MQNVHSHADGVQSKKWAFSSSLPLTEKQVLGCLLTPPRHFPEGGGVGGGNSVPTSNSGPFKKKTSHSGQCPLPHQVTQRCPHSLHSFVAWASSRWPLVSGYLALPFSPFWASSCQPLIKGRGLPCSPTPSPSTLSTVLGSATTGTRGVVVNSFAWDWTLRFVATREGGESKKGGFGLRPGEDASLAIWRYL